MAGVCVRRKVISRRTVTTTMHCFHYELCVNLVNQIYPLPVITHSIINLHICILTGMLLPHSASSSLLVGLILCRKSEGLAYENAENQYSRQKIRQKMDHVAYIVRTPNSKSLTEALVFQPLTMSMSTFLFWGMYRNSVKIWLQSEITSYA